MYLDSFPFAQFLELFTCVGYVWDYNGGLVLGVVCWIVTVGSVGIVVGLLVGKGELELLLAEGPMGEMAVLEGCFDVVHSLVKTYLG